MADPIVLRDAHGRLFDAEDDTAAQLAIRDLGYQLATPDEVVAHDQETKEREEFGTATQQALAAGELALGSATFGLATSDSPEAKARRRQLRKQSPFIAGGAEAVGALAPGLLTAGAGSALAGAATAGRVGRAAALGVDLAADVAGGMSLEAEQAREQGRRIDVGNVAMWSLGGVMAENLVRAGFRGLKGFKNNVLPGAKSEARAMRAGTATGELTEAETRRYVENWDEAVNHTRTLAHDAGNSLETSFDQAHGIYFKPEDIRGSIDTGTAARKQQASFVDETYQRADKLASELEKRGNVKTATVIRKHMAELEASADAADLFIAGDQLKRSVQKFRKKASAAARTSGSDPFNELVAEFDAVEKPLRQDLEKSKIWGDTVARKQKDENALWAGKDGFVHNAAIFQNEFYSRLPGSAATDFDGMPQFAWDDDKLMAFMSKDRLGQRDVLEAGEKMIKRAEELTKVKEQLGVRPDDLVQLKTDLADMKTTLQEVRNLTQARLKGKDLMDRLKSRAARSDMRSEMATAAGAAVGGSVAGPIGAAAGAGLARRLNDYFTPSTIRELDPLVTRDVARARINERLTGYAKAAETPPGPRAGVAPTPRPGEEYSLAGKSLADLGTIDDTFRPGVREALQGSDEFMATGRVPRGVDKEGHEKGITLVLDGPGSLIMRDGSHRFSVAKEGGLKSIWGTVVDGETGKQLYRGDIPLQAAEQVVEAAPAAAGKAGPSAAAAGAAGAGRALVRQLVEFQGQRQATEINDEDTAELSEHGRVFTERAAQMLASSGRRQQRLPDPATRFQGEFPTLRDAFNARKALLVEASADPSSLIERLAESFGDLPDTHPGLFAGLAARASAGVTYLVQNLPPSIGYSMRDPAGLPPSTDAIREFARTWDAVFTPANALHDIGTGRATPKQIQAVATVHPDVFAEFQSAVLRTMSNRLTPPPYESQRYVDQVLMLDGAYSPALSRAVANNVRNSLAAAPSNPQGLSSNPLETSPDNPRGIASIAEGPTNGLTT